MTARIINFSYITQTKTLTVTYSIYDENNVLYRTNMRRSFSVTEEDIFSSLSNIETHLVNAIQATL